MHPCLVELLYVNITALELSSGAVILFESLKVRNLLVRKLAHESWIHYIELRRQLLLVNCAPLEPLAAAVDAGLLHLEH